MPKAKPILLEPIGKVEVLIPEEYTGTIIGDFNKRRGIILGRDLVDEKEQKITAEVPMAEMMKYSNRTAFNDAGPRILYHRIRFAYEPAPQPLPIRVSKLRMLRRRRLIELKRERTG